ncbi:MAG TPA: alpha/beta hydrolase [Sphingomicrobium sp.]|nr:alpha/beta hydrolase [Sphingomicrobium sp.]
MRIFAEDSLELAYIDEGEGQPVLLIHGFGSTHRVNWVDTGWVTALNRAGYRVIAFDNRGHGASTKLYDPADYHTGLMAQDAARLLAHLCIRRAAVMGYSMGARIAAFLALARPDLVSAVVLGGLGIHLVDGVGLPTTIADAMEAEGLDDVEDPMGRMFRAFAEQTKADRRALAACIRGSRQTLSRGEVARIGQPALVAVGTRDKIAGSARELAALLPDGMALDIPDRDHNPAVGDKRFKEAVTTFLGESLS